MLQTLFPIDTLTRHSRSIAPKLLQSTVANPGPDVWGGEINRSGVISRVAESES